MTFEVQFLVTLVFLLALVGLCLVILLAVDGYWPSRSRIARRNPALDETIGRDQYDRARRAALEHVQREFRAQAQNRRVP